ncbi:holo-ACP synthase [Chitinispirillales bacterium ANBcel5]|uniref:holo-ACP synthase n=1 Tax=Cellulosispirillum alkaliphilum TaxID=3039283 RepID=UPI002A57A3E2|nr:holo-ACP synthase [Chitinispirillales bacterium ANBcel5]
MIKGLGVDIVEIARISRLIDKYGELFIEKIFTQKEVQWCETKAVPATHYAGRWATKEAFYKALPDSIQPFSTWKSIQIVPDHRAKRPVIEIIDMELSRKLKEFSVETFHLSISHERSTCIATVILS